MSKYWTLSDCYLTHSPSTDLYRSYHTQSPSTGDSQTVTTLIVQVLAFIRLLPYTLSKYWTLSDCYLTHSPSTEFYGVTTLKVQALVILRLLPHSLFKYWHLSDCYHTCCPNTGLYQTVTSLIVQVLIFIGVTTLKVQALVILRLLPHSLFKYWHLSDCYHTRCPNTGLYQTVTSLIVQVPTFIGVTTLIVQALVVIRLLPHSLFKYWHLSDCYHTRCPNTGLYQTVTSLIVQVLTFIGVTTLIVKALVILRLLPHSLFKYWHLSDCYHTRCPNTGLYQTVTSFIVQVLTFIGVTTLKVQALVILRLLPHSLFNYWHLSDCYHTRCPNTGLCQTVTTHIVQVLTFIGATTLKVQALVILRLLPHSLFKYWHLSDCYHTRCPNTGLYQTVTSLIVQVLTFIGVTTLIVQALVNIRLLPHSLFKYWHLSDCYHTRCPNTGLYQTVTSLIVQVPTFIGVTTLIVQALVVIRLLPHSLFKYWHLSECYHTRCPNTGLYQTVTSLIVQVLTFIGVTTLIVKALVILRLLPHSLFKYWHLSDCYHTRCPNTGLYQTVTSFIVQVPTFIGVTTLKVQALVILRLLPHSLFNYWHLSDCYHTRCPNTGLCQTVTTHIVQVLTFIGVTTLKVQALVILRLLPHSLFKYWHLSDCYHTRCPNTGLYQTVTSLIVQVLTFIGVTTLIVQALVNIRLLPHSLFKYWHLLDCYHTRCPNTGLLSDCYLTHSPSTDLYRSNYTKVQALVILRLLPYSLFKYWYLSDCYHTHYPNT